MLLEYKSETSTKATSETPIHTEIKFQIILLSTKPIKSKTLSPLRKEEHPDTDLLQCISILKAWFQNLSCSVLHICTLYTSFLQAKLDAMFQKAGFPLYTLDSTTMLKHSHYFVSLEELSELFWTFHKKRYT